MDKTIIGLLAVGAILAGLQLLRCFIAQRRREIENDANELLNFIDLIHIHPPDCEIVQEAYERLSPIAQRTAKSFIDLKRHDNET